MSHPVLPRLKKDRTTGSFYITSKYLRYWDGTDLYCEHRILTGRKCAQCLMGATVVTPATLIIPSTNSNILGNKYEVLQKVGVGAFGEVYSGSDLRSQQLIAIKVEQRSTQHPQLLKEYAIYRAIPPAKGIPNVHWCGSNSKLHILVIDLLVHCNRNGGKLPAITVSDYARQALSILEHIHSHNYIHCDLKPENMLLGIDGSNILHLVDFGLAKMFRNGNGKHIDYRENRRFVGTPQYVSIGTHLAIESRRRDDLESLGYVLIFLAKGRLPWQGIKATNEQGKYDLIGQLKQKTTVAQLCEGLPPAFAQLITISRSLQFAEKPPYDKLRTLFTSV